ncbi:MAG: DUF1003 domain-containing protein [Qingshengfaniella sp.]
MNDTKHHTELCHVCGKAFPLHALRPWVAVRPGVGRLIEAEHPGWQEGRFICEADLATARRAYVESLLEEERGELGVIERQVLDAMGSQQTVSQPIEETYSEGAGLGDRVADRVASFGGSWTFILGFLSVLVIWMGVNALHVLQRPFDPYPFILLNLMLSSLAAFQAPIIMMSQRRQEEKDRLRAENDYRVNLKAELEIRQLHEKIDHQLSRQWEKLAELQKIQIDLLEEKTPGQGVEAAGKDRS